MSTNPKTIEGYNQHAREYADHVQNPSESPFHAYYEKPAMYAELPELNGKTVISLGCGSGEDSQYLKTQGAERSVGIDISEKLINIAKHDHPDCEFRVMDILKLDFENETFDFAYSSLAIHYIYNGYSDAFREIYRVLRPGSVFLFSIGHAITNSYDYETNGNKKYRRLGAVINTDDNSEQIYGDYLSSRPVDGRLGIVDVSIWRQPTSDTINQLITAGFVLDKCIEPRPLPEFEQVDKRNYERLLKIPDMIIFKSHKPN